MRGLILAGLAGTLSDQGALSQPTGELGGDFLALDARDGRVLYRHDLGAPIAGGLVAYTVDGRQYLAVASGAVDPHWQIPEREAKLTVFTLE